MDTLGIKKRRKKMKCYYQILYKKCASIWEITFLKETTI